MAKQRPLKPNEIKCYGEATANPGFPARVWVPDKDGKCWFTPLLVYSAFNQKARLNLFITSLNVPYATVDVCDNGAPPFTAFIDLREVVLYSKRKA